MRLVWTTSGDTVASGATCVVIEAEVEKGTERISPDRGDFMFSGQWTFTRDLMSSCRA